MPDQPHVARLCGTYFRMKFVHQAAQLLEPAHTAEGRFHYDGQAALYLSETPRGTIIASKRYLHQGDPERAIFPIEISDARVVDLRDAEATGHFGIDETHRGAEWQTDRAQGRRARTWDISDRVRALDLDGILYASRSQPSLSHVTLFRWNVTGHTAVTLAGAPIPFEPIL